MIGELDDIDDIDAWAKKIASGSARPFDTVLSPDEESKFQAWKSKYAPKDSGDDYDLRGAFKQGLQPDPETGHWPDTFKKPNHPTFSVESKYAKDRPDLAGSWDGENFSPHGTSDSELDAWASELTRGPDVVDLLTDLPVRLARGAVRGVGMIPTGAGALLGKASSVVPHPTAPFERSIADMLISAGTGISSVAPRANQKLDDNLLSQAVEGVGTSVPAIGMGLATGGLGAAPMLTAGAVGATSVAQEAGGGYEEAIQRGATPAQAETAATYTAPAGFLDILPEAGFALRLLDREGTRGAKSVLEKVLRAPEAFGPVGGIAAATAGEGIQEAAQGIWEQYAQKLSGTIKSDEEAQSIWDVATSNGVPGGLSAALMEAATRWMTHGHGGHAAAFEAAKPPTPKLEGIPGVGADVNADGSLKTGAAATVEKPATGSAPEGVAAPAPIELPDADLTAARDRFHAAVSSRRPGTPSAAPTLHEAPEAMRDRAGKLGMKVALVDAGESGAAGYYDRDTKTALIDARSSPEAQSQSLLDHELTHFMASEHPETFDALQKAIDTVAPRALDAKAADREGRQRAFDRSTTSVEVPYGTKGKTRTEQRATQGPVLSPGFAREEATAETVEGIPNLLRIARENPDVLVKVAQYRPTLMRRFVDALKDFARKLGIGSRPSLTAKVREIESLLKTPIERGLGAKRGAELALKVAELQKSMEVGTPVAQPRSLRMPVDPSLSLPPAEAGDHPTPLFQDLREAARVRKADADAEAQRTLQDQEAADFRQTVRQRAEDHLADLDKQIARLPEGKRRKRVDWQAADLRAALEEVARTERREAPKAVGDLVLLPSGERGRVTAVQGATLKVFVAEKRYGDPDTTLGLAEKRTRTVAANAVEAVTTSEPKVVPAPKKAPSKQTIPATSKSIPDRPKAVPPVKVSPPFTAKPITRATIPTARIQESQEKGQVSGQVAAAPSVTAPDVVRITPPAVARKAETATTPPEVVERIKAALSIGSVRRLLEAMGAREIGQEQRGGEVVGEMGERVRLPWVSKSESVAGSSWWDARPPISAESAASAIDKALNGKKLGVAQAAFVDHAIDEVERRFGGSIEEIAHHEDAVVERDAIQNEGDATNTSVEGVPFALHDVPAELPKGRVIGHDINGDPIYSKIERGDFKRDAPKDAKKTQIGLFSEHGGLFEKEAEKRDSGSMFALARTPFDAEQAFAEQRRDVRSRMERIGRGGSNVARPLANPSASVQVRRLAEAVKELHLESEDKHTVERAQTELDALEARDPQGTGTVDKLINGESLDVAQTLQAQRLVEDQSRAAFRSRDPNAMSLAIALQFYYADARARASAVLRAAQDVFATPQERFLSTLYGVTSRAKEQMRKAGTPAARDKILAAEQKKIEAALFALNAAGFSPDTLTNDYFRDGATLERMADIAARAKGDFWDWLYAWRAAGFQFGTLGPLRNVSSNAAHIAYDNVFGKALSSTPLETKRYVYDMIAAVPDAMRLGYSAWRWGHREGTMVDEIQKAPGWLGLKYVEMGSTNVNAAGDAFFRHVVVQAELRAFARAEAKRTGRSIEDLLTDPALVEQAEAAGRKAVFADRDRLTNAVGAIRGIADIGKFSPGKLAIPFIGTPTKIVQRALETASGPVAPIAKLVHDRATLQELSRDQQLRLVGNALAGLGLWAAVYALANMRDDKDRPLLTGSRKAGNAADQQDRIAPAYSFSWRGGFASYQSLDPFGTALPIMLDVLRGDRDIGTSALETIKDKSFFRGIQDLYTALTDEGHGKLGKYARDVLWTPMIPNALRSTAARANRTRTKEINRSNASALAPARLAFAATGMERFSPPLKYDYWGREDKKPGRSWAAGMLDIFPTTREGAEVEHVDLLLGRYNRTALKPENFGAPPQSFDRKGVRILLDEEEYARLCRDAGTELLQRVKPWAAGKESLTEKEIDQIRQWRTKIDERIKNQIVSERK